MSKSDKAEQEEEPRPTGGPQGRVTIHYIAEVVGLHFTTVARALKGSRRVAKSTAERVRKVADELGYRVDPMVSAFCSYRASQQTPSYRGNLIWINGFHRPDFFEKEASGVYLNCYLGAKRRCEELGYLLESLWIGEPGMSARRAADIVFSRGGVGLIVAPMPPQIDKLDMPWEKFCSVRIGYSLPSTPIANVVSDQFSNMQLVWRRLRERGFRRIGLACEEWVDDRVGNKWSGAYLREQEREPEENRLPIHFGSATGEDARRFCEWFVKHRPEVIVLGGLTPFHEALVSGGFRVPEDVSLVWMSVERDQNGFMAGIDEKSSVVGAVAVDQVLGIVNRSAVNLESYPKNTMVPGQWRNGLSCSQLRVAAE